MESKAKLFGHPIHQTLVAFPLGALGLSAVFDVLALLSGNGTFSLVAFLLISVGMLCALVVIPFGLVDWWAIPRRTRAARVGGWHALGNLFVLLLFAFSWWARRGAEQQPPGFALVLSFGAVLLLAVTGWLGGELVSRLGVGVADDAGLDARSSLERRPDAAMAAAPGRDAQR